MAIVFTSEPVAKNTTTKNLDLIKAAECKLQEKHITIDKNLSMTEVKPDAGYQGLSSIEVDVEIPVEEHREVTITENGTTMIHPADGYDYMEFIDVIVNVPTSSTYDITQAVVNLYRFTGTSVPANVVGWENLVDGSHKCTNSNLTSFEIDLPNVGDATEMFSGCYNLRTFKSNLSSLHSAGYMFTNCTSLTDATINISSYSEQEQEYSGIFAGASILTNLTIEGELRAGLWLHSDLTLESLLSVINALVDLTGENSKTLTLGATNLAKLSDEQKAIATNKNWILA